MFTIELIRDQLSATFYRRLYYGKMREMIGEHRSARHSRLYALDCAILLYAHRMLWLAYVVYNDYAPILGHDINVALRNDMVLGYAYTNPHFSDPILMIIAYMFALFIWICETQIWRLEPRTITWRWWYELVVTNQDAYRDSMLPSEEIAERRRQLEIWYSGPSNRRRMLVTRVAKRVYCSIAARVRLWWTLSDVDQRQLFAERQQSFLLNLSHRIRRKSILYLIVIDYLAFFCQMVTAIIFLAVLFVMSQKDTMIAYTTFARVWIIADLYIAFYWLQRLMHLALFFTNFSIFAAIVHAGHVIDINRSIYALIRGFRSSPSLGRTSWRTGLRLIETGRRQAMLPYHIYRTLLSKHLTDHNKICYTVLRGSYDLFGSVMFVFVLSNLPINIYLIRKIWFSRFSLAELFVALVILLCQLFTTIVVFGPLARCCKVYHSPVKFIPRLQAITDKAGWLRLKLKYDDLYGRLISGAKIGLSIGPIGAITYKLAFEFVCLYVAYLLVAFGQKIEYDLKCSKATIAKINKN